MAEGAPGKSYLEKLYERAIDFNDEKFSKAQEKYRYAEPMSKAEFLYRNMSKESFDEIMNGSKFLKLRDKGENGDPRNEINWNLQSLFFCANTKFGKPPQESPYGPKRILFPIKYMAENLNNNFNLYFADFYCMIEEHYIVIVMTRNGSGTDKFCREKLPSLPAENPFFMYEKGKEKFMVSPFTWVEIMYTDQIYLVDAEKEGNVSYGQSTKIHNAPRGRRKNRACKICNVKAEEDPTNKQEGMFKAEMMD